MERAQAHTLEGFMAALIIVSGVLFALGATAVTPLSASTSNQHIQNQQVAMANDLLATTHANGTLRSAVVHWNTSAGEFKGSGDDGVFTNGGPPNAFGDALNTTFRERRIAFNVYVHYLDGGARRTKPITFMGSPSDNAVSASRTVILYNDTRISAPGTNANVSEAWANGEFYAPDVSTGTQLFNVVEVRVVVWRM